MLSLAQLSPSLFLIFSLILPYSKVILALFILYLVDVNLCREKMAHRWQKVAWFWPVKEEHGEPHWPPLSAALRGRPTPPTPPSPPPCPRISVWRLMWSVWRVRMARPRLILKWRPIVKLKTKTLAVRKKKQVTSYLFWGKGLSLTPYMQIYFYWSSLKRNLDICSRS